MSITITDIGHNSNSTGATVAVTVPTIAAGSLVLVLAGEGSAIAQGTLADSVGNTYVADSSSSIAILFRSVISTGLTSGQAITFTKNNSTHPGAISAFYATSTTGWPASPLDLSPPQTLGTNTTPSITSGTPSVAGELFAAFVRYGATSTFTQDSTNHWVAPFDLDSTQTNIIVAGGSQVNASATSITFAPSLGTSVAWRCGLCTYKPNVAANPSNQYDWPNPVRTDTFPNNLKSWAWSYNLRLIGQDKLPNRQQDWPVPKGPEYHVQFRTWAWQYNPNLIGQDQFPNRQQDWPLPTAPWRSNDLRAWIWYLTPYIPVLSPFSQTDWPLPVAPFRPNDLRTWVWNYNPNLIGKDKLPFRQQDWPLPVPNYRPRDLTWAWSYNLNLIGKDKFPTRQQDWVLPVGIRYPAIVQIFPNIALIAPGPVVTTEIHNLPWLVTFGRYRSF